MVMGAATGHMGPTPPPHSDRDLSWDLSKPVDTLEWVRG